MRLVISILLVLVALALVDSLPFKLKCRDAQTQTVVTLAAGPITGLKISSSLYKFLGIPYAQAPVGTKRFASPVAYPAACLLSPYFPLLHGYLIIG